MSIDVNAAGESPQTCFIISPIGAAGSPERVNADDFLNHIVLECPEIKEFNYEVKRSDSISVPGRITTQIIDMVANADLVIADLTGLNPNVFYELALRHAIKKPMISCVAKQTDLPFDLRDFRTIFYGLHVREAAEARKELGQQIRAVNVAGYEAPDPVGEAIQVAKLQSSPRPLDNLMGEILQSIQSLESRVEKISNVDAGLAALGRRVDLYPQKNNALMVASSKLSDDEIKIVNKSGIVNALLRDALIDSQKPSLTKNIYDKQFAGQDKK